MKFLFFIIFFGTASSLLSQGRALILCDGQSPKNCYSWDIGSNIAPITPKAITGPILPLNGGTMSGLLRLSGGFGLGAIASLGTNIEMDPDTTGIYGAPQSGTDCTFPPTWSATTTYNVGDIAKQGTTTYTSIVNSNLNNVPPNATFWVSNCTDDRTRLDWHGMEGDFIRIKGKGPSEIGDYFDITRNTPTGTLPLHQLNFLNDSSFNTLLFVNETNGLTSTNFDYSGEIRFGLNSARGVTVGMSQHTCTPTACDGVIEINNGTIMANGGTADQLRILGLLVNQDNDNSGYLIQSAGGIEMSVADATHNILSKSTANNAFDALNGGVRSQALYFYPNTAPSNPATGNGGFEYIGSGSYQFWNGTAWVAANLTGGGGFWTRNSSGFIYPTTNTDKVMVGRTTDDTSGGFLQVTGGPISIQGGQGILINQLNDGSGYLNQVNGGIEQTNTADNILSKGTANNSISSAYFTTVWNGGGVTSHTGYWIDGTQVISSTGAWTGTALVSSVTGTPNEVTASPSTGAVVLSLPQPICTTCLNVTFGGLLVNTTNDSSGYLLQVNGGIEMVNTADNILSKGTANNAISANAGGITATTGYYIGANLEISNANGGQFVGPGGVHTNGTIVASGASGSNFIQSGTDGFYVSTNQAIDNGAGPRFVGAGGVNTAGGIFSSNTASNAIGSNGGITISGGIQANGVIESGTNFQVGGNVGTTRNIVTGSCTINVVGGIVTGSTGC